MKEGRKKETNKEWEIMLERQETRWAKMIGGVKEKNKYIDSERENYKYWRGEKLKWGSERKIKKINVKRKRQDNVKSVIGEERWKVKNKF